MRRSNHTKRLIWLVTGGVFLLLAVLATIKLRPGIVSAKKRLVIQEQIEADESSVGKRVTALLTAADVGGTNMLAMTDNSVAGGEQELTPEQKVFEELEELLDNDDFDGALRLAQSLLRADDPEVRSDVITALGWIGFKAMPSLAVMLGDPDSEVAGEAMAEWLDMIEDMESERAQAEMLAQAMKLTTDEDILDDISMGFTNINDHDAVRALADVIQGNNKKAAAVAREEYEGITGEPFTTVDDMNKWIQNNPLDADDPVLEQGVQPAEPGTPAEPSVPIAVPGVSATAPAGATE